MKMSLENDIGARKLDNDKSARHFTSFQIKANSPLDNLFILSSTSKTSFQIAEECTIKRPRFKTCLSNVPVQVGWSIEALLYNTDKIGL